MIRFFTGEGHKPVQVSSIHPDCWIDLTDPTEAEVSFISGLLEIPKDFLTDPLDVDERARMEREDGMLLVVVRTPVKNPEEDKIPYFTMPVGIIITGDHIVTVSRFPCDLTNIFVAGNVKYFSLIRKSRFAIQLLQRNAILFLNCLRDLNKMTESVEGELQKSLRNEELVDLVNIEKSLVYFTTSLKTNGIIMESIRRRGVIQINDEEMDLIADAIVENDQAISMSKIHTMILNGLMDAFASIISNNLNRVMKFLASVTIILMIPNLVASFLGMNVRLPFQDHPWAFAAALGAAAAASIMGILVLSRYRWL
jgi:magnesium transporter